MSNILACHQCSAQYDITGYQPGVQFACTTCGAIISVPQPGALELAPEANSFQAQPAGPKPRARGRGMAPPRGSAPAAGMAPPRGAAPAGGMRPPPGRAGAPGGRGARPMPAGAGRGRAARGGYDEGEDDGRGRYAPPKNNTGLIIGLAVGGVALLGIILVVFMNSGTRQPTPDDDSANAGPVDNTPPPPTEAEYKQMADSCASQFVGALKSDAGKLTKLMSQAGMQEELEDQFELYYNADALVKFYGQAGDITLTEFNEKLGAAVHVFEGAQWDAFAAYTYERLGTESRIELKMRYQKATRRYLIVNISDGAFINRDGTKPVFRGEWIYWVPVDIFAQKNGDKDWIPAEGEYTEKQKRKIAGAPPEDPDGTGGNNGNNGNNGSGTAAIASLPVRDKANWKALDDILRRGTRNGWESINPPNTADPAAVCINVMVDQLQGRGTVDTQSGAEASKCLVAIFNPDTLLGQTFPRGANNPFLFNAPGGFVSTAGNPAVVRNWIKVWRWQFENAEKPTIEGASSDGAGFD